MYFFFLLIPPHPSSTLFPYTTLFRSRSMINCDRQPHRTDSACLRIHHQRLDASIQVCLQVADIRITLHTYDLLRWDRSEEHTSELQSHVNLVCRLLLEKKKKKQTAHE